MQSTMPSFCQFVLSSPLFKSYSLRMKTDRDPSLDSQHPRSVSLLHFTAGFFILVYSTRGVLHSVANVGLVDAVELVPFKKHLKVSCLQKVAIVQSLGLKQFPASINQHLDLGLLLTWLSSLQGQNILAALSLSRVTHSIGI